MLKLLARQTDEVKAYLSDLIVPVSYNEIKEHFKNYDLLNEIITYLLNCNYLFKINNLFYSRKCMDDFGYLMPDVIESNMYLSNNFNNSINNNN